MCYTAKYRFGEDCYGLNCGFPPYLNYLCRRGDKCVKMEGALIILGATVLLGVVLYALHRIGERRKALSGAQGVEREAQQPAVDSPCCGMHITCEKDSLLSGVSKDVVYYDDEELDAYKDIPADGYDEAQIEQFRDVLFTLLPGDIAGWARSLQLRGIEMPDIVRQELLLIVAEAREAKVAGHP